MALRPTGSRLVDLERPQKIGQILLCIVIVVCFGRFGSMGRVLHRWWSRKGVLRRKSLRIHAYGVGHVGIRHAMRYVHILRLGVLNGLVEGRGILVRGLLVCGVGFGRVGEKLLVSRGELARKAILGL